MHILNFILCFFILILYGYLYFIAFGPKSIDFYETSDKNLLLEYDYIVVGSGSAGSVISSRLAEDNQKVLVIESGSSNELDIITMPAGFPSVFLDPSYSYLNWGDSSTFKKGDFQKKIPFPRGKVVGGCGSINANIWNIGNHKIYDKWEELGAKGWNYREIERYFKKAEEKLWIQKYPSRYIHRSLREISEVATDLYGTSESFNENTTGFAFYETTMRNGRRWSTADAYLKPALRKFPNLHLKLNTTVNKIVFNPQYTRAVGVLLESNKIIKAKKEVILSAGAFNSPAILMRSGVGPREDLEKFGIKVIKELPGVGKNLQSHPSIAFIVQTNESRWESLKDEPPKICDILDYFLFGTGKLSSNIGELGGYFQTKHAKTQGIEDLQYHCEAVFNPVPELVEENSKRKTPDNIGSDYLTCIISLVSPRDTGKISLKSTSPNDTVEISLNFLQYEEDLHSFFAGIHQLSTIFDDPRLQEKILYVFPNKTEMQDKTLLTKYIYKALFELYHPTGTCKMGDITDNSAVVDESLKVKGFENLRVVDASIFPEIVNSNTNAPTVIIAEKAYDLIRKK